MSEQELEKVLTAVEDESDVLGAFSIRTSVSNLCGKLLAFLCFGLFCL